MGLLDDMWTVFRHITSPKKRGGKSARKRGVWVSAAVAFTAAFIAVRGVVLMTKNVNEASENVTSGSGSNFGTGLVVIMLALMVAASVFVTVLFKNVFGLKKRR